METTECCAFRPCSHAAVMTLRLLVDGCDSVVPTCQHHAHWLRSYADEDDAVLLVDEAPERPSPSFVDNGVTDTA